MLPLLLLPLSVGSEPPAFVVTNRVPPFVVVNKVGPKPAGPRLTADGIPADPAPPGREWQRRPGEDWKLVKVAAAPGVAAPQTFRGSDYHPPHDCPVCGRAQYVISGFNPDGTHNHTCSAGHTWRH